ncbi:MAG: hypothetical protein JWQ38_1358 [Flavipsychrobacter sp.]|nr:hypothetical protein [Flavipsychrobacter sp.]
MVKSLIMKRILSFAVIVLLGTSTYAQMTEPANGGSSRGITGELIGLTNVTVNYGRPAVNGREGKIWGDLVYAGFKNQGFGSGNDAPWRAGANENTIIEFSTDVQIEGKPLAAGKYGFFVAYGADNCTLVFSSNTSSWGSYFYDKKEDVLRVNVKPVALKESQERLVYEFSNEKDSSATLSLKWEKLAVPFTISTNLQQLQLASFERELRGDKGFDAHSFIQYADYLSEHNIKLDEALKYANRATRSLPTFQVYMLKGNIQEKLHMQPQADSSRMLALKAGNPQEVHNYARGLLKEKKSKEAMAVFQANYDNHPGIFTTTIGLARGYAATGKSKDALKYANKALPLAPDERNKKAVNDIIAAIKDGKDVEAI